jgi:hypothetical protein
MGNSPGVSPIQNQSGLQYPDSAPKGKLSDLLQTAHGALSSIRDHYSDMVNRVADTITQHTPNYDTMPPETQRDLGTVTRAGLGAYGVPVPPKGTGPDQNTGTKDAPLESVVTPKGGEEGAEIPGLKGVKVPKGSMDPGKIQGVIEDAAGKGHSVVMTYQNPEWDEPKTYHVEPYSYRQTGGDQTLMAFDKTQKGIRAFKMDNIVNAATTNTPFKPRWEVEIGPPKPGVTQAGPKARK